MGRVKRQRMWRIGQLFGGVIVFGVGVPVASMALSRSAEGEGLLWLGLSLAFAAYVAHAFLLVRETITVVQWLFGGLTVILGALFFVWFLPFCELLNGIRNPNPRQLGPGEIGDLGLFGIFAGSILSGVAMSVLLWVATRDHKVGVSLLVVAVACGVLSVCTAGYSSLVWHLCFASVLYAWVGRQPLPGQDGEAPECDHCGYDLRGLTDSVCPECGGQVSSPRMEQ